MMQAPAEDAEQPLLEGLPPLVLDCGTGVKALGEQLGREGGKRAEILFTHLHMDHLFGFPFFSPLFAPSWSVRVTVPALSDDDARDKIARYLSGEFHPIRLRDLPADVSFHGIPRTPIARLFVSRPLYPNGFSIPKWA